MPLKAIPPRPGKTPYWSIRGTYLGVYVDRSAKTRSGAVAKKLLHKWEREIERGEFAERAEPTFASAALSYMAAGGERLFLAPLLNHWGEKPLREIDQAAIDTAALALYPTARAATRNRQVYTPVSAILKHAGIDHRLKRPKGSAGTPRTRWLWPEQAEQIFEAAEKVDAEFAVFLHFLCYTGLRLSEALRLQVSDVRLAEGFAFVTDTKNGEPRPVHLNAHVVATLASHPQGLDRTGALFRFRKNGRLYNLLKATKLKAGEGLEWVTFHTFRHTWATWMRRFGNIDTAGLVATGAWKDRKSAARYEHVVVSEEARRADLLPTPADWRIRGKGVGGNASD
jgi:integrase